MRNVVLISACVAMLMGCSQPKQEANMDNQETTLTQEWDKVFPKSDKVEHKKITFHNRYGIELVADMYVPKNAHRIG